MRRTRPGSLGSLLPISLVEPDGLIVTTDGRYIRVIECDRVPNTITADPSELGRIEGCFAHLCRIIPDRQGLVVLAQTDPVVARFQTQSCTQERVLNTEHKEGVSILKKK